ncbi:MAG TPA: magnesium-translocating P-type ATPase [Devosia sp.]|nr:magnesium-translocating P-type ATPase [Devosia sp.]
MTIDGALRRSWPAALARRRPGIARPADRSLKEAWARLGASPAGLSGEDARSRLVRFGYNRLREDGGNHPLTVLLRQFRSPMVLILLGAAILSAMLGEADEAAMVAFIVLASTGLGFHQEYRAGNAVAELRRRVAVTSLVRRDGREAEVPSAELVPGDILLLRAGSLVPADAIVLEASALHVDESVLTGESFPVVKAAATEGAPLTPTNLIHMGTSVRSGEASALVTATGAHTEFGSIATSVAGAEPETSFARGTRRFGLLMTQIMFVLVTIVLVANVLLGRPVLDSLLFAAALAVGITPELLPAIVTATLSSGSRRLSDKGVIVRRLVAIENLGTMDVLCTDKTGTLTAGEVRLDRALDVEGKDSAEVLRWAVLNASLQTALPNPLDNAILARRGEVDMAGIRKQGEVPYDFERKRLSVVVAEGSEHRLACKGAAQSVLAISTAIRTAGATEPLTAARRQAEQARLDDWSRQGWRVIAVAIRTVPADRRCGLEDECELTLLGYLLFADPLKPGIAETIAALAHSGVTLRIVTGDNRYVAEHVAAAIGLAPRIVVGEDLEALGSDAFARRVADATVFAEVTPDQKEHIVAALRRLGHTVGYLGDGINDAPSLRAADVGISVENAVDAAKSTADVILLERDLEVLLDGIIAGRTAFGNTVKYIAVTISANFGNMISMAAASLLLPFLPMLAAQILLNNLLSDLPMLAVSTDHVDAEMLNTPRHWDFHALVRSMLGFGLISSAFDALTFLLLLEVFHASPETFQTAWFVESLLTELVVVAVMRTRRPFYRSLPSPLLIWTSAAVAAAAIGLPFLPVGRLVGFVPLEAGLMSAIVAIVAGYLAVSEILKRWIGVLGPEPRTGAA